MVMEREGLQNPSRQGWVSRKEGVCKKNTTSDGSMRMSFFLPWVFSHCLATLTTQPEVRAAAPAASEKVANACLGFLLYPFLILHRSMNFASAQHISSFPSLRSRLSGCFCVTFSLSCHPMCLPASLLCCPAAALLTKMLFALKAWQQLFSKSAA